MSVLDALIHRLRVLRAGEEYAREQEREIRFHLELAQLATRASEGHVAEAEATARRKFGNVTYYREEARVMTHLKVYDRLRQDLTYTVRSLRRTPGFSFAVILTLALGVGVNGAMFSMFDALFLRTPAGVAQPEQIRRLYVSLHRVEEPGGRLVHPHFEYPQYKAIVSAEPGASIAAIAGDDSVRFKSTSAELTVRRSEATRNFFEVLRLRPALGRFFAPEEDRIEIPAMVAVISDELWRVAFHRDPGVINQRITLGRRSFVIVGVAPEKFRGIDLDPVDVWVPLNTHIGGFNGKNVPWYETFAMSGQLITRLPSDMSEQQILGAATNAYRGVRIDRYEFDPEATVVAGSIMNALGPMKTPDEIRVAKRVAAMALFVLLIACANVANLLMLRVARRKRELTVRRALGASQRRVLEQIALESITLALAGGVVATVVAFWSASVLRALMMPASQVVLRFLDIRTVSFVLAMSVLIGVAASSAPGLLGLRANLVDSLRAGSRDLAYQPSRLRSALVVVQTALCVVLLVGAGLFLRSLWAVESIPVGYDSEHLVIINPVFANGPFPHAADLTRTIPVVANRLAHIRGVTGVAFASLGPMSGVSFAKLFLPNGDSLERFRGQSFPVLTAVSPGYFTVTGVRILNGRGFLAGDGESAPGVAVVNETMARALWPGKNPIGQCLIFAERTKPCATVVGVAADAHVHDIIEGPALRYFRPLAQSRGMPSAIIVRLTGKETSTLALEAERSFREVLPSADGTRTMPMSKLFERELRPWRLGASLFTAFAVLALLVASVGVYSVVAYGVSQRTGEMGLRIALGARTPDIINLVLADVAGVVAAGIATGLVLSLAAGRLLNAFLFGVTPMDPSSVIMSVVTLALVAVVACLIPALRAARVDPSTALRAE